MTDSNWVDFLQKILSVVLGATGTWLAVRSFYEKKHQETLDRYAQSREKSYAAERDFEHLRRNQEQMKDALKMLDDELTETREDFKELKGMLYATFNRVGVDSISGVFANRKREE